MGVILKMSFLRFIALLLAILGFSSAQRNSDGESNQPSANKRFLFGSNGLLGGLFGGNDCPPCDDGVRRKRQTKPNKRFFFGGNECICPDQQPTDAGNADCKGRPQGDIFYGCGCEIVSVDVVEDKQQEERLTQGSLTLDA